MAKPKAVLKPTEKINNQSKGRTSAEKICFFVLKIELVLYKRFLSYNIYIFSLFYLTK